MSLPVRCLLISFTFIGNSLEIAHSQEKIEIPPRPTEREYKTQEQIRREWTTLYAKARVDAVAMLKAMQGRNGAWATLPDRWGEDVSPLVIEALLENDVPLADPVIVKGLKNLRYYVPETTIVVAMQTVVLCKVNDRQDRKLVERNVDWLLKAAQRDGNRFRGWGQIKDQPAWVADVYTFYAVMALRSAQLAGIKIDPKIWTDVRDLYLDTQKEDGGWPWVRIPNSSSAQNPTIYALYGLHAVDEQIGGATMRSVRAIRRGFHWLVEAPQFTNTDEPSYLYALSQLGQLRGDMKFVNATGKKRDCFDDGTVWIINHQMPSGTIFVPNFNTATTTASALLFLAAGK